MIDGHQQVFHLEGLQLKVTGIVFVLVSPRIDVFGRRLYLSAVDNPADALHFDVPEQAFAVEPFHE